MDEILWRLTAGSAGMMNLSEENLDLNVVSAGSMIDYPTDRKIDDEITITLQDTNI